MADNTRGANGGWKKYFKVANVGGELSPLSGKNSDGLPGYGRNDSRDGMQVHAEIAYRNYASRLPEVYSGHPNRIERYNQYEQMDMDAEINACLDILATKLRLLNSNSSNGPNSTNLIKEFFVFLETPSSMEIKYLCVIQKHLNCTG